nr:hypothetical protein [Tanacetum cinerariifolium]GEZ30497.1 hypothetical protein [Tanacetum cinerariifolium]GEZ37248.1 hypothetical protein [Tanacetum cinerariifolium]
MNKLQCLGEVVEQGKSQNPHNNSLENACKYTKIIQELLILITQICPSINGSSGKLVAVTPMNKAKSVRFTELVTSSGNTNTKTASLANLVFNNPALSSTGVKPSTSASGSQPLGNTKKVKIQRPPHSTQKNKVEAHPRTAKSSLKNKNCNVKPKGTTSVQHSMINANFELICVKCNASMLSNNHDLCVVNDVNAHAKSKSVKKFKEKNLETNRKGVHLYWIYLETYWSDFHYDTPKPVITLVYSRKPTKSKSTDPVSKSKVVQIVLWYLDSGCSKHISRDRSQLTNFVNKFLDFDELTAMASEQSSLRLVLHEMTPATISSGLVPNHPPSTPFVPPLRTNWDLLFQPLFDKLLTPTPRVYNPAPEFIAPNAEVVASTGLPSSTTADQYAPSPSNSQTTPETQTLVISNDVEECRKYTNMIRWSWELKYGDSHFSKRK